MSYTTTLNRDKIKVSIIMPAFNAAHTIDAAIKSVIEQTYKNIEYIIIDGGSSDGSVDIIRKYENKIHYWISEPDSGIYHAMNKGIILSKGDWIFFIGADDKLYNSDTIKTIFHKCYDGISLIYGNILYQNREKHFAKMQIYISYYNYLLLLKNSLHHQAVFYRRSLFHNFRYNPTFKVCADYELNLKSFVEKVPAKKINQIVSVCGNNGVSKRLSFQGYKEQIIIKNKYIKNKYKIILNIQTVLRFLIKKYIVSRYKV